jgi:hypothetical protein
MYLLSGSQTYLKELMVLMGDQNEKVINLLELKIEYKNTI